MTIMDREQVLTPEEIEEILKQLEKESEKMNNMRQDIDLASKATLNDLGDVSSLIQDISGIVGEQTAKEIFVKLLFMSKQEAADLKQNLSLIVSCIRSSGHSLV